MGLWDRNKLPKAAKTDFKQQMLNAEKLLGYDPGSTDHMAAMALAAQKGSFYEVVRWIGPEMFRAIRALPKAEFSKLIALKDIYKNSREFKLAAEVCEMASALRPQDQNLLHEARSLATEETIKGGGYDSGEGFTRSIRDRDVQQQLIDSERDVRSEDVLSAHVRDAQRAYDANPADLALLKKLVDALRKTEQPENENRAIELLDAKYQETGTYAFRDQINTIKLSQLNRLDRSLRESIRQNPKDADLHKQYQQFFKEKTEEEMGIFKEKVEAYPTATEARYEMARRMFILGQFEDVIPVFQQVRNDPKFRTNASINLGRAFYEADFVEEAIETLGAVIADYVNQGDEKSKDMTYWYARALEKKGEIPTALKSYSQVFQWEANYKDVRARIKQLRGK
jgi:hypothetical protein